MHFDYIFRLLPFDGLSNDKEIKNLLDKIEELRHEQEKRKLNKLKESTIAALKRQIAELEKSLGK